MVASTETVIAAPAESAALLVEQGRARERDGDESTALKRYRDAISIDATSEAGYVSLGALRARRGELVEAANVYEVGLRHVPSSIDLLLGRARLRALEGRHALADDDLRRAWSMAGTDGSAREIAIVRERIGNARAASMHAVELAGWRRLLAIGRERGDTALVKDASVQARALSIFLGPVDVVARPAEADPARRAIAAIARRG